MRILVAEDSSDVAALVAFGARMVWPGCEVVTTACGAAALARFERAPPDLVVLDISMPPPDGFEVLRRIRLKSRVPVLVLTVRSAKADRARASELGADDYLTKPFDAVELLARLRALVKRRSAGLIPGTDQLEIPGGVASGAGMALIARAHSGGLMCIAVGCGGPALQDDHHHSRLRSPPFTGTYSWGR